MGGFRRRRPQPHSLSLSARRHSRSTSSMLTLAAFAFSGSSAPLAFRSPAIVMQETIVEAPVAPPPPPPAISVMRVGDKTLAGDWGFDPLQLADSPGKLAYYREAEVKHARLAMLAAAGWPVAELLNGPLSKLLGTEPLLQSGRVPSILNGGLGSVNVAYWVLALGLAVFVESKSIDMQLNTGARSADYLPGMIGFDPLKKDSPAMRAAEILNGRIAMVAITVFALEEAIFRAPVVTETPIFFKPFWTLF